MRRARGATTAATRAPLSTSRCSVGGPFPAASAATTRTNGEWDVWRQREQHLDQVRQHVGGRRADPARQPHPVASCPSVLRLIDCRANDAAPRRPPPARARRTRSARRLPSSREISHSGGKRRRARASDRPAVQQCTAAPTTTTAAPPGRGRTRRTHSRPRRTSGVTCGTTRCAMEPPCNRHVR